MHFGYGSTGIENLVIELAKPFTKMSIRCMNYGQPMSATLWRQDGTGLEISSEVHDVAEKREVGNLLFALKHEISEVDSFFPENVYPSPLSAMKDLTVVKLTIFESGSSAEGGVLLTDEDGKSIAILTAAYPYCIATKGVSPEMDKFASEYDLDKYQQVILSNRIAI